MECGNFSSLLSFFCVLPSGIIFCLHCQNPDFDRLLVSVMSFIKNSSSSVKS